MLTHIAPPLSVAWLFLNSNKTGAIRTIVESPKSTRPPPFSPELFEKELEPLKKTRELSRSIPVIELSCTVKSVSVMLMERRIRTELSALSGPILSGW